MRKDWQTLELCDRFFDAIEQNDYDTLEACYAPEAVIWHSHDCLYQPRADNLAMLKQGMKTLPKVRFKDRRIRVFEGGFVQQHTIYVTRDNGFVGQMDVCFVGYVRDGMISRAYEYFDTGQIEKFLGPAAPGGSDERCRYHVNPTAGWSSLVARRAHNPKVAGSNPAPATNRDAVQGRCESAGPSARARDRDHRFDRDPHRRCRRD